MSSHNNLLKARFHMNMGRINSLVNLIFSDFDKLKPKGRFQSDGVRADILRSIVVFLHATFEDTLRSHISKTKNLTFYSRTDIEKALSKNGIDTKPFQPLYPPLTQMAKRRKRIVHEADLSKSTDIVSEKWRLVDDWQLIMWVMAVPAFYYQLRISINSATTADISMYEKLRKTMLSHVDYGKQLISFTKGPSELQINALQKAITILETMTATLKMTN